jgi:5-oxoprolinase (ATP-hydrolysing) subunit A
MTAVGRTTFLIGDGQVFAMSLRSVQPAHAVAGGIDFIKKEGCMMKSAGSFTIDINCDLGEGFGAYAYGGDEAILPYVTSANIACGFHAGDPSVMRRTVNRCLELGVRIGAHPGFPDLQGFGRRELQVKKEEAYELVLYQLGALEAFLRPSGGRLHHVKPHGALYNMAARSVELAASVAAAVRDFDPELKLYALSGSELIRAGQQLGLTAVSEVFADRSYRPDGSLTPRTQPGAVLDDEAAAAAQVLQMVTTGAVRASDGSLVPLAAETVCIHGDTPGAAAFAVELRHVLDAARIRIASPL